MIMKKGQAVLAAVITLITGVMVGVVLYLTFIFPKILAVWEQEARTLSVAQMFMVNISSFCTTYGIVILPIFLIGFLASILWLILAVMKKSTANNEV